MAPELLKGEFISEKSDIWSLGIIIYYMLFRNYPYNGNTEFQIIKNIESKKQIELSSDKDLNDLITKMLTIDINERISWNEYKMLCFFFLNKIYFLFHLHLIFDYYFPILLVWY